MRFHPHRSLKGNLNPTGNSVYSSRGKSVILRSSYWRWLGAANKGVSREAVDLVVFTRLHPDHVGWNLTNGQPAFPKARYLVPRKDWDYWTQPPVLAGAERITNQVLP